MWMPSQARRCEWCGIPIKPRRDGGKPQRFCSPEHRLALHRTLKKWAMNQWKLGKITTDQLRNENLTL